MSLSERNDALLAKYLDGELSPDEAIRIEQHIGECLPCAAEVAMLVSMKRGLQIAERFFSPSAEFRRKIQQQVSSKPRGKWNTRLVWAFGVLSIALFLSTVWLESPPRRAATFSEVVDLHVNAIASTNPVDVVSTDRHTVKPWFQGRIPFSFNIPESQGKEFTLLGGRMVYLNQDPGAQLIFTVRQHRISTLVFQESSVPGGEVTNNGDVERRNGFNVAAWNERDLRFIVIGDADANEIRSLVHEIKSANQ
jgi:anti-sigma factor RsiW